jgi:hypothetical protein
MAHAVTATVLEGAPSAPATCEEEGAVHGVCQRLGGGSALGGSRRSHLCGGGSAAAAIVRDGKSGHSDCHRGRQRRFWAAAMCGHVSLTAALAVVAVVVAVLSLLVFLALALFIVLAAARGSEVARPCGRSRGPRCSALCCLRRPLRAQAAAPQRARRAAAMQRIQQAGVQLQTGGQSAGARGRRRCGRSEPYFLRPGSGSSSVGQPVEGGLTLMR